MNKIEMSKYVIDTIEEGLIVSKLDRKFNKTDKLEEICYFIIEDFDGSTDELGIPLSRHILMPVSKAYEYAEYIIEGEE